MLHLFIPAGVNKEVSIDELQEEKENLKSRNRYSRMTEDQKAEGMQNPEKFNIVRMATILQPT